MLVPPVLGGCKNTNFFLNPIIAKLVEAAGVEPASLEPLAQTATSLVSVNFRASSLTTTHEVGGTLFILDSSPFLVFFARYRRPSSLTSIQSRTGRDLSRQQEFLFFGITELSENLVSFSYGRNELHINHVIGS